MPLLLIPIAIVAFIIFVLTRKKKPEPQDAQLLHDSLSAAAQATRAAVNAGADVKSLPSNALAKTR
jgi:hypothetical protein